MALISLTILSVHFKDKHSFFILRFRMGSSRIFQGAGGHRSGLSVLFYQFFSLFWRQSFHFLEIILAFRVSVHSSVFDTKYRKYTMKTFSIIFRSYLEVIAFHFCYSL